MELDDLKKNFKSADITVVLVDNLGDDMASDSFNVVGELKDYVSALKALAISVVFVELEKVESDDFVYRPDDETEEEDGSEEQDLCSVIKDLATFKAHLGDVGRFTLYAPMRSRGLSHTIENSWYSNFLECRDDAIEAVEQQLEEKRADVEKEDDERAAELTKRIVELGDDQKFARLPTQRAMIAYAKLNVPGFDEIDDSALRDAISDLRAQLMAKGAK